MTGTLAITEVISFYFLKVSIATYVALTTLADNHILLFSMRTSFSTTLSTQCNQNVDQLITRRQLSEPLTGLSVESALDQRKQRRMAQRLTGRMLFACLRSPPTQDSHSEMKK